MLSPGVPPGRVVARMDGLGQHISLAGRIVFADGRVHVYGIKCAPLMIKLLLGHPEIGYMK